MAVLGHTIALLAFPKNLPYNGLMAKFFGLDIPSGLEDAFNAIVSVVEGNSALNFKHRPSGKSIVRRSGLAAQSLFVLWQSLYDGFDSTRKGKWTDYWGTLPFGPHSGSNGWPGSGFSAFVYVNAPRYKAGEDLLLDPPAGYGPELITNGGFDGNADGWVLDYGDNPFSYTDHGVLVSTDDLADAYLRQTIEPLTAPNTFHLEFDMSVLRTGSDDTLYTKIDVDSAAGGEGYPYFFNGHWPDLDGVLRHYSYDGFLDGEGTDEGSTLEFKFVSDEIDAWDIFITNVSLKQVL